MNKFESGESSSALNAEMANDVDLDEGELLSALVDGELHADELSSVFQAARGDDSLATWQTYHLIGDALRSPDLVEFADSSLVLRLREQLKNEGRGAQSVAEQPKLLPDMQIVQQPAANADVFRWKMFAGFASLAAVAAIGWSSWGALQGEGSGAAGAQLASTAAPQTASASAATNADGQAVMLRDPRLDELLAAHKQFGAPSALQMPASFLRNATFEAPAR